MSILLSTPALPRTRTINLSISGLHLKKYSLSTSVCSVSIKHCKDSERHELVIQLAEVNQQASNIEQEVEVSVEVDKEGLLLADVTPAGETFWGFDGRWAKKRVEGDGRNGILATPPSSAEVNEGDVDHVIVELFGPETFLDARKEPKLEVVVGHGGMVAWGTMHAKMHTDESCSVGAGSDFRLVVWLLTSEGETWASA